MTYLEHVSSKRLEKRAELYSSLAAVLRDLSQELNGEDPEGLPMLGHFATVAASKAAAHKAELERRKRAGKK